LLIFIPALLALGLATASPLAAATPILNYGVWAWGKGYVITPGAIWYGTHGNMGFVVNYFGANDVWLFFAATASPSFEWTITTWHYVGNMLIISAAPSSYYGGTPGPCPIIITIQLNSQQAAIVLGCKVFFTGNIWETWTV